MADEGGGHKKVAGDLIKNVVSPGMLHLGRRDSSRFSSDLDLDPYDEDQAELRFLQSKPTCFLVLGKPGVGKTAFAAQLAEEWKCQFVNANQVITEAIHSQSELGRRTDEILLRGESVPEELAVKLLEEKIRSPEVAHHGYVLDDFPCLSEEFLTIKQQLDFIDSWPLTPDFIIHLKIPDLDLEKRRTGQKVDPATGELYTKDVYDPEKYKKEVKAKAAGEDDDDEEEEEEEVAEEEEEEDESNKLSPEIIERLIKRPEDMPSHVGNNIQTYKSSMLRLLEDYMADHNQQCLIELDANKPSDVLVQDTLVRLSCFRVTPAAVPIRLNEAEAEEESVPDDMDTDDLFRSLGGKRAPSSRFRWRRSRWQRCCPVALTEGDLLPGRADLAVAFLDKIYCLSSEEALSAFLKNPRPYLLPPQPRPPCKLIVTGPPLSGKTTLSDLLASKYGAQVLDIKERMRPKLVEERERRRIQLTEEVTQASIIAVQARLEEEARRKIKEEQEAHQRRLEEEAKLKMEEAEEEEDEEEMEEEESTRSTEADVSKLEHKESKNKVEDEVIVSSPVEWKPEAESEEGPKTNRSEDDDKTEERTNETEVPETGKEEPGTVSPTVAVPEIPVIEVTADHPDVVQAVEEALNAAKLDELQLPVDGWMETLEEAIEEVEMESRKKNPSGPLRGGWILDNFPETKEQWSMLFERNVILPDCVLALQDNSPNGEVLIKRWYMSDKDSIDRQISDRLDRERYERQMQEEEKQRLIEEQKAQEEKVKAELERLKRLESGELEEGAEEEEEKEMPPQEQMDDAQKVEEEDQKEMAPVELDSTTLPEVSGSNYETGAVDEVQADEEGTDNQVNLNQSPVEGPGPTEGPLESAPEGPLEGPEVAAYRDLMKKYDAEWMNIVSIITGNSALEPFGVDIAAAAAAAAAAGAAAGAKADASEDGDTSVTGPVVERSENEVSDEVVKYMERIFMHQGWERTANDIDEEEGGGDMAGEEEEEEEEQEEEEESEEFDPSRSIKKPLGDTSFYCPVTLKEKGVLWPGDPECGAKYREKVYYLSDADARDRFLADPVLYLPTDRPFVPPPLRILLLGPRGAGKTTHGRHLAKKLGLFHIQFRERLQELVIAKTKKKVVPEREEEPDELFLIDDEPEEVSPAISILDESKEAAMNKEEISTSVTAEGTAEGLSTHSIKSPPPVASTSNPVTPSVRANSDSAEQEVLDEVPAMQLTDEEESIVSYLRDDEPLPAEFLLKLLEEWWHQEPFKSTGFILEGFPSTADEVTVLGEHGLYPDAAVVLNVEDTDVLARLLPPKMDRWRQRRDRKHAHRKQVKERKKEKREREMKLRKEELLNEAEARRQERLAEKQKEDGEATDEDEDEPEDEDIDAKIAEEFEEEEEEEEEEETEEDASDRMKNDFMDIYETDSSKISNVTEKLMDLMIPRIEIDSGRRQTIVRYTLTKKLKPLVEHRMSMFERVFPISERLAQKMLTIGYKQKSRFGQWCPVKLSEGDYQQPRHGPGFNSYPAIHRAYIYFLSSQQAREEFMHDPLTFLCQPSPKPVVPIRMAIIGPPKSGKSTLAKRFADDFGVVRLSIGEAIRNILANQPRTELAKCIQLYLYQGLTVPDECAVQALDVYLMDVQCQTRGYILDGYPLKKIQFDFMEERNIIPFKVIELQVDNKELANRATKDRYSPDRVLPLHDSAEIFAVKLSAWQTEVGAVREWFQRQHINWVPLPGDRSKWWMWNSAKEIARKCVVQIQTYLQRIAEGKAASIADMCITPAEFAGRLADFGQYCPVSLALKGELCDCSPEPTLKYGAEFQGHYYMLAGPEELEMFLRDPEKFVPPNAPRSLPRPELLPKRRTGAEARQMFPKAIELQGYCPVTFLDGKQRYEAIVPGNPELVVEYRDKLFSMETEEKLHKFMRLPEKYWNLKLPHKLPARKEPMRVNGLPMLGYLEQTVAQVVTKAMTAVGNFKPKYPFMSATQSALVYFALQLKAINPNSTDYVRKKYKRKLVQYEETCELISYLGTNMSRRYKEPKDRPIDFDFKLEKFMQLQTTKVQPNTWVS